MSDTRDQRRLASPGRFLRDDLASLQPYHVDHVPHRIKLDANESPFDLPHDLKAEIADEWQRMPSNRYPDAEATQLRRTLAERIGVPEPWITVGNGSDEIIADLILAMARDDATILAPEPTFSMYRILSRVAGVAFRAIPLDDRFRLDTKTLLDAIRPPGPHVFFFSYPNNTTGNCWEAEAILALLAQPDVLVVADEAYFEFSGKTFLPEIERNPNLIILRTFSKAFGMAALRLGYMVADPAWVDCVQKVRLPYNVNAFCQMAARVVLKHTDRLEERVRGIVRERERVFHALKTSDDFDPFETDANFVLFRTRSGAADVFKRLVDAGILIRNLDAPGPLEGCLRVTVGTPDQNGAFLRAIGVDVAQEDPSGEARDDPTSAAEGP